MFWKIYEVMSDSPELRIGDSLPEGIEIFDIQSKIFKSLSDEIDQEKTTILNFGSCTWPPFMKALDGYKKLVEKFTDVDSMIIYIDEAHPTDEWFLDIPGKSKNILKIEKLS